MYNNKGEPQCKLCILVNSIVPILAYQYNKCTTLMQGVNNW